MHQSPQGADELRTRAKALRIVTNQPLLDCKKAAHEFARDCDALALLQDDERRTVGKLVSPADLRPWVALPLLSALDTHLLTRAGIEVSSEREQELVRVAANLFVVLQHRVALLRTYVAASASAALLAAVRFERDGDAVDYLLGDHWNALRLEDGR